MGYNTITACTVVQAVAKANSQSNGKGQISTPRGSNTPERIFKSRLTDFGGIWHVDANWTLSWDRQLKFRILKIQDGGGRHLENHKNRDITATI